MYITNKAFCGYIVYIFAFGEALHSEVLFFFKYVWITAWCDIL